MRPISSCLVISFLLFSCKNETTETTTSIITFTEVWKSEDGFVHPESVIYHQKEGVLYISNIGSDESNETPNGFISKVALSGEILELKWLDSIQSPKGQCIVENKYYVSALDELLEVNIASGEIIGRYTTPEVTFLNDVAADEKGNVFVSGMRENAIYKLDTSGSFVQWYQNDSLNHPNGLLVFKDLLIIGGWGNMDEGEQGIDSVGHLMAIDLQQKSLRYITKEKPGKLDGIQVFDEASEQLLVSSWKAGELFLISLSGELKKIKSTPTSVGDILYLKEKGILALPQNFQHQLDVFTLKEK